MGPRISLSVVFPVVFPLLACGAVAVSAALGAQERPLPADRKKGGETIDKKDLTEWLTKLSSKEFAGRGTGQPGFQLAADYIKSHFEELQLKPGSKDGKYFQPIPWTKTTADEKTFRFTIRKGEKKVHEVPFKLVRGNLDSTIRATGKGFVAVIRDLDDPPLDEVELSESVLFLLVTDDEERGARSRSRAIQMMLRQASRTGAAAVFLVDDSSFGTYKELTGAVSAGSGRAARGRFRRPNSVVLNAEGFAGIAEALGTKVEKLKSAEGTVTLDASIEINIEAKSGQAPAYNVIGVLPGSDPKLKDEYVVIGCHLDHLGKRGQIIYPGADDDGSGSAGLMAISRAFAKNDTAPKRSVMFVAFCGEEMGLIGSGFFARNPPIKLSQIVAELQIDMIGRDETGQRGNEKAENNTNSLHLIGTKKLSMDLHELCLRLNSARAGFDLEWDEENVFYRSDHWNFAKYGIPIAFFFTGFHRDYHRPSDTVEKINFDKLTRISRYVYDIGWELADAPVRPLVDERLWQGLARKGAAEPAAPVRKTK